MLGRAVVGQTVAPPLLAAGDPYVQAALTVTAESCVKRPQPRRPRGAK
jgi:hypothetical protein